MTCVCSLAGTAACKTCWNNPESTGQFNNFVSWNTTSNYDIQRKNDLFLRSCEDIEVVRCKECRHFKKGEEQPPIDWCDWFHDEVAPRGFCAWGEKAVS